MRKTFNPSLHISQPARALQRLRIQIHDLRYGRCPCRLKGNGSFLGHDPGLPPYPKWNGTYRCSHQLLCFHTWS